MKRNLFTALLALLLTGCGYWVSTTSEDVPTDGKAPPFELSDQHGDTVSLETLLAQGPVVVEFHRGEFCSLATGRVQRLQRKAAQHFPNATVVAISTDDAETVRAMADEHDIQIPLLADPAAEVVDEYGVMMDGLEDGGRHIAVPSTFVIAPNGQVVWAHVGKTAGGFAKPKKIARAVDTASTSSPGLTVPRSE